MGNPIDTTGDGGTFIGSREKAKNGFGQNGYQGPSSIVPGDAPKKNIPSVSPPTVTVPSGDWQTRDVGKSRIAAHDAMPPRTVSDGNSGGTIPKSLNRTTKREPD